MSEKKTHQLVKEPRMTAKELADYMTASESKRRTIVRNCKFRPIARLIQHDEAKTSVARFIRTDRSDLSSLDQDAERLRTRLTDSEFERDLFDNNADYIERFSEIHHLIEFPEAEFLSPGAAAHFTMKGVRVSPDIRFRLRRVTRANKIRIGAGTLRYAKGKALDEQTATWQSAFIFGYLGNTAVEVDATPERQLCLTVDAYAGVSHIAPGDSARRFNNMLAACESIAERWPNIAAPLGALL
jgi:hypothetical protein